MRGTVAIDKFIGQYNDELRLSVRIYLKEKEKAIDKKNRLLSSTICSFFFVLFADGKHKSTVLMICCPESKLVREVVQTIWKRLNRASPSKLRGLVGGTGKVEGIFLDVSKRREIQLSSTAFARMFPEFSSNIRYLYLNGTAIEELPSSIGGLRELIYLDLVGCHRLKNLPNAVSKLGCLEKLDLSGCSSITEFPKVSRNIRELYLDGTAIREIPSSIECLCELNELHLRNCKQFEILPSSICKLRKLQRLNLSGCLQFRDFPEVLEPMYCLRYLYLEQTRITKLPSPIGNLKGLACLEVGNCKYLNDIECFVDLQVPKRCVDLDCLRKLNLDGCSLSEVPDSLGLLSSLEVLDLSGNNFYTIPISINKLFELQYLGLRNCMRLRFLPELPPRLSKLDVNNWASSFCLPGDVTPEWFSHQRWGSTVTFQLSSHWANSEFLGFSLCAVIAFRSFSHSLQVKCTYHFRNMHNDSHDLYCYLHGWYDERRIHSEHIFVGFDPCLVAKKDYMFSEYSEVSVEFQLEDMNDNLLPLDLCQVIECGVRLLHANDEDEIHRFAMTMPGYYHFYPLDRDGLEATQLQEFENNIITGASTTAIKVPAVPEGAYSFYLLDTELRSGLAIEVDDQHHDLQVNCTYRFRNKHSDSHDLSCYLHGWYDEKKARSAWTRHTYSWDSIPLPDVPAGASSFCLPGDVTPEWFSHQRWGSTVTFQLSSHWANSEFLGFSLCAVIAFRSFSHSLQVKCTYHFRNMHNDSHDLYCYLHGWYDERRIHSEHIFVGFDPCLVAKKDYMFSEYSEVSVEFQLEDMNDNLLPLDLCQVIECGVRLLHANDEDEIHRFAMTMPGYYHFYPLDRDGLEATFQAKRTIGEQKKRHN
ncbi:hypothetical protein POTOM_059314 [Populus tomentosa]|uniref:C-JID domain-containing protein n=1 Tax=Populus tomentosa TaxID=118781 RepID=A0A8X8C2Z8_POPTO|nr:hypothetical protein POTOM_059314 [Populus tomentosa]